MIPVSDLVEAIDSCIRTDLDALSESWFTWLGRFTVLVVVGLVFELPEIWHDTLEAINHMWHKGKSDDGSENGRPAVAHHWRKLAGTVGWFLIVIGVGGEFVAESFSSKYDGLLRTFDEISLTAAARQAEEARNKVIALETPTSPRHLSYIEKEFLSSKISHFRSHQMEITCFNGGAEAVNFERDFIEVLNRNPDDAACLSGFGGMKYTP
ncbi:MAG: hypothetical protein JOZ80_15480, partial [Acidobacteriaceae bacterium]|nr:hypothetical protein [Acidobacteriaceae bacterium]